MTITFPIAVQDRVKARKSTKCKERKKERKNQEEEKKIRRTDRKTGPLSAEARRFEGRGAWNWSSDISRVSQGAANFSRIPLSSLRGASWINASHARRLSKVGRVSAARARRVPSRTRTLGGGIMEKEGGKESQGLEMPWPAERGGKKEAAKLEAVGEERSEEGGGEGRERERLGGGGLENAERAE